MRKFVAITSVFIMAVVGVTGLAGSSANAHVTVKPAEVVTAGFQVFTVSVPNERETATTTVKLLIPANVKHVTPTQKPGWAVEVDRSGTGEDATVKAITWKGSIAVGMRDEFTFSAQVPASGTALTWKAYQTYADGALVSWDKDDQAAGHGDAQNSGPFSVTDVVPETSTQAATDAADATAQAADDAALRALSLAGVAALLSLVAIYLLTRTRR